MTQQAKAAVTGKGSQARRAKRLVRVLVVDSEKELASKVSKYVDEHVNVELSHVTSLEEASQAVIDSRFDLAFVDLGMPNGGGLGFAAQLQLSERVIQTALVAKNPSVDEAIAAMRLGVKDILRKPLGDGELERCLDELIDRQHKDRDQAGRVKRLKKLCKKLNQARMDVSEQVDVLCSDLVMAYQELACQMQQVVQTGEYSAIIRDELDLEVLLRKTLEHVVEKVGPTNAAVFLPSATDEFSLGGYVNYDCTAESADMMLQHLADVVAPKVSGREDLLHVTDNETLAYWIGDDAAYLADSHVVAVPCKHEEETLAVMVLFRDNSEAFADTSVEACGAMGPLLAEALAKVIRVHHRAAPEIEDWGGDVDDDMDDWGIDL